MLTDMQTEQILDALVYGYGVEDIAILLQIKPDLIRAFIDELRREDLLKLIYEAGE